MSEGRKRETTPERMREYARTSSAFASGEAYQRELDIRRALQVAKIPTDVLTSMVLISIMADQLADHPRPELFAMIEGMLDTAAEGLAAKKLCPNDACRAGIDMSKFFDRNTRRCLWCGTHFHR